MSIPCLATETSYEVRCPVCRRGFLLLTEPTLLPQRGSLRRAARKSLAAQHDVADDNRGTVHPDDVFELPGWDAEPEASLSMGQALLWGMGYYARS